jgi:hypothetical protein
LLDNLHALWIAIRDEYANGKRLTHDNLEDTIFSLSAVTIRAAPVNKRTYNPDLRIPSARADSLAGLTDDRYPIRVTLLVCCASAMAATASSITAIRIDGGIAFFICAPRSCGFFITDAEAEKSIIYGRRKTGFVEGKKANFQVGLN